jgi:hypothetical protein
MFGVFGDHSRKILDTVVKFIEEVKTAAYLVRALGGILRVLIGVHDLFEGKVGLLVLFLGDEAYRVVVGLGGIGKPLGR